jgi:elongation factor 1 alpha-like protein
MKLDIQVQWEQSRYEEICSLMRPFLLQSGFQPSKTRFVPVGAMAGINLVKREGPEADILNSWYQGPTLVDFLGSFALFISLCSPLTVSRRA